jgi:DNA-binding NarL/FixJ family response regulator
MDALSREDRQASQRPQELSPVAIQALQCLAETVVSPVKIYDTDCRLVYLNVPAARLAGRSREELLGLLRDEVLSPQTAGERNAIVQRVLDSGCPIVVREVLGGIRWSTHVQALPEAVFGQKLAMVVQRAVVNAGWVGEERCETIDAQTGDYGPLARLSKRELEVLRMLGEGLSTRAIAGRLKRSEKTVKSHRLALGRKLNISSRVMLARTAIWAGLCPLVEEGLPFQPIISGGTPAPEDEE